MNAKYPEYPTHPISDIRDLLLQSSERFPDKTALEHKSNGKWIPISYRQLCSEVERAACGLAVLGLLPQTSKLAIVGENCPEWATCFLAAACTGLVCVPIDKALKETEVYHILHLSGAQAIVADDKHLDMVGQLQSRLPQLQRIIAMNGAGREPGILGLTQVKSVGQARIDSGHNDFLQRTVTPDDLLSILFTSGTMGNSKGVMLTHGNIASNLQGVAKWVNLRDTDRFLSILPMHHTYECTNGFLLSLYRGAATCYAESLRRVVDNMVETRATAVLGVPLLWHALYEKIEAGLVQQGMWKINLAKKVASLSETMFRVNIRRRLFAKLHDKFGGSLRILISGGAPIDPKVARGFRELGIDFLQGYGLTESGPIIAVNRERAFKDEAAGLPLPNVEVKIAEDGEILARGPNIMKGYYNNPEATSEALEGGWLHTGDLGYLDSDGFLQIRGRKKSVIVTPGGKKIYPEELEAEISKSPSISECLVCGEVSGGPNDDVEIEAIVVPDTEFFLKQGFAAGGALDHARVEEALRHEVKERCKHLAGFKRVSKVTIRYEEFEKTTTRKVKRYLYTKKPPDMKIGLQK